jgi:alkylhydroperoxidase family enzyme
VHEGPEVPCWSNDERALIAACDGRHEECTLSDAECAALREHFSEEAVLEILMLAGFYRTVSYLTNALQLAHEPGAARFPSRPAEGAR